MDAGRPRHPLRRPDRAPSAPTSSGARRRRRTRSRARRRGRQGPLDLGHVQPHAREDRRRRHGRRRLRPLPPDARRRRAHGRLGVNAYRFSVSWPRIAADGAARSSRAASTSTTGSSTSCSRTASRPSLTLYHWDLPQALEDEGGWLDARHGVALRRLRGVVGERLGDRVHTWITLNEAVVSSTFGYGFGTHAPGKVAAVRLVPRDPPPAARPRSRGAGDARRRARALRIGITHNLSPVHPVRQRRGPSRGRGARRDPEPHLHGPGAARRVPRPRGRRVPVDRSCVLDGDLAMIAAAARRDRHQLLQPDARVGAGRGQPVAVRDRADPVGTRPPTWAGRSCPTACARCSSGSRSGTATPCRR